MIFIGELDPYSLVMYTGCAKKSFLYVMAFESYRVTACEYMHLVRRDHFRSRDKDAGRTIVSSSSSLSSSQGAHSREVIR